MKNLEVLLKMIRGRATRRKNIRNPKRDEDCRKYLYLDENFVRDELARYIDLFDD